MALGEKEKPIQSLKENDESSSEWLHDLQKMREKRKPFPLRQTEHAYRSKEVEVQAADKKTIANRISYHAKQRKLKQRFLQANRSTQDQVYSHYLAQWEKAHNEMIVDADTPTQVLLAEKWKRKNEGIVLRVEDEQVSDQLTVLIDKQGTVKEVDPPPEMEETPHMQDTWVTLTIAHPDSYLEPTKKLCVVNEEELIHTLKEELKPQLQNLLEGMVSTMLANNYEILLDCIQQELLNELPSLLEEALEHQLNRVLRKKDLI